jgi:hypothetical protein
MAIKERFLPQRRTFRLFEDVGAPHEVTATIYTYPFRHIVIDNFLPVTVYEKLVTDFNRIFERGLSMTFDQNRFSRFDLYDLFSHVPKPTLELPYGCFFSETHFRMLESALARTLLRDTSMTYHHHEPTPEDNYIHNDYVYQFLGDDPLDNGVNPWYYQCALHDASPAGRPVVRAATSIFYLSNEGEGQGGETAIFAAKDSASLVRTIAPVNNRLLAFDISPISFHSYLRCTMPSRNSLAQWYYVLEDDALRRFEGRRPGGWEHLDGARA